MPVTPASVSATNATPLGTRSSKSSALSARFTTLYCFSGVSDSRYRPRTVVSTFRPAIRQSVPSRLTLINRRPDSAIPARLDERVDVDVVALSFGNVWGFDTQALSHHRSCGTRLQPLIEEVCAGVDRCAREQEACVSLCVARCENALQLAQDEGDAVGWAGVVCACADAGTAMTRRKSARRIPHVVIRPRGLA